MGHVIDITVDIIIVNRMSIANPSSVTYLLTKLVVEGGVGLGDLWVKGVDLLWWWVVSLGGGGSSWLSRKLNVLCEVEFVALHGDVFTEVLVSVHTGGEVLGDLGGA